MSFLKYVLIVIFCILFTGNISKAVLCARLISVSAGEIHTLALADEDTLWACGSNDHWQLGLGSDVPYAYSLQQVKGENGAGFLNNIVSYDAGLTHSLATDANGILYSWGKNPCGQLGNGPANDSCDVPGKVHGVNDVNYLRASNIMDNLPNGSSKFLYSQWS